MGAERRVPAVGGPQLVERGYDQDERRSPHLFDVEARPYACRKRQQAGANERTGIASALAVGLRPQFTSAGLCPGRLRRRHLRSGRDDAELSSGLRHRPGRARTLRTAQVQGWNYDPAAWDIIAEGDNHVWRTTQQAYASTGWARDIAWFLRVRRVNSDVNLYFRTDWPNDYALRLEAARLVLWTERDGYPQDLASANVTIGTDLARLSHRRRGPSDHRHRGRQRRPDLHRWRRRLPARRHRPGSLRRRRRPLRRHPPLQRYPPVLRRRAQRRRDRRRLRRFLPAPGLLRQPCLGRWTWGRAAWTVAASCALACQPADRLDRWTQTNGPWLEYIRRIRFDPDDPHTLIASSNTGSGVIKSSDAGQTWHEISGPPAGRHQPDERLWPGHGPAGQEHAVRRHGQRARLRDPRRRR